MWSIGVVVQVAAGVITAAPLPIASDVQLTIEGVDVHDGRTVVEGIAGRAELDAGQVNIGATRRPRSGRQTMLRTGKGGFVVWTFRATVVHSGVSAQLRVEAGSPDARSIRYALGTDTRWDAPNAGRQLPGAGWVVLHPALASGQSVVFELALPVRPDDAAGRRSAEVRYFAELNGRPAQMLSRPMQPGGERPPLPRTLPHLSPPPGASR